MDKQGIIGLICLALIAMLWLQYSPTLQNSSTVNSNKATFKNKEKTNILTNETIKDKKFIQATPQIIEKINKVITKNLDPVKFGNQQFFIVIDPEKGLLQANFSEYKKENKTDNFIFLDKNKASLSLKNNKKAWQFGQAEIKHNGKNGNLATFVKVTRPIINQKLLLTQIWKLKENAPYQYSYDIIITNLGDTIELNSLRLNCGFIAPLTGANSYMSFADQSADAAVKKNGELEIESYIFSSYKDDLLEQERKQGLPVDTIREKLETEGIIQWLAVKNQYFANIIESKEGFSKAYIGYANLENPDDENKLLTIEGNLPPIQLKNSEKKTFSFSCYTGPQRLDILEKLNNNKKSILQFSLFFKWKFAWLGFISEFLLKALNFFNNLFGSYGMAIIALTISIKAIFWHLTKKSNISMKRMQKLSPQMQELRAKYKDNPQLMQKKTMALYRENGVNPISGCLPILLQMPIYIALFSMIRSAIELRHKSFLWVNDLAQPDTLFSLFGLDFRLLVLIWVGLMIYQQRIMPINSDALQRNMMLIMPVIMLLFCYGAPSALTLYFAVQGLVSLIQYKINNKQEILKIKKKR